MCEWDEQSGLPTKLMLSIAKDIKSKDQLSNGKADHEVKATNVRPDTVVVATVPWEPGETPVYSPEVSQRVEQEGGTKGLNGWYRVPGRQVVVPALLGSQLLQTAHKTTHLGKEKLEILLGQYFSIYQMTVLTKEIIWHMSDAPAQPQNWFRDPSRNSKIRINTI